MNDIEVGRRALQTYYSYMRLMYPVSFKYSQNEFLDLLQKMKGGKTLLEGLGLGIRESGMSDSKVSSAMKSLALKGQGKVPASFMDFFNALMNESAKISYVDAAAFVIIESTKDVAKGVQSVGENILLTGKILNFIMPAVALFFVFYWLNNKSGGSMGRLAKRALK